MSGLVGALRQYGAKSTHFMEPCYPIGFPAAIACYGAARHRYYSTKRIDIRASSIFVSTASRQQVYPGVMQSIGFRPLRASCVRLSSSCNYPETPGYVGRVLKLAGKIIVGGFAATLCYNYVDETYFKPSLDRLRLSQRGKDIILMDEDLLIDFKATNAIKEIEKRFLTSSKPITILFLTGQAGSGKLVISQQDAHEYENMMDKYPLLSKTIVVLDAQSPEILVRSYIKLAKELEQVFDLPRKDVPERIRFIFEGINNELSNRRDNFFLIFNGVQDYSKIQSYIPRDLRTHLNPFTFLSNSRARVLITGTVEALNFPLKKDSIEARLTLEEGLLLFNGIVGPGHPAHDGYSVLKTDCIRNATPVSIKLMAKYIKDLPLDTIEKELEELRTLLEPNKVLERIIQKSTDVVDPQLMRFLAMVKPGKFSYSVLEEWCKWEKNKRVDQRRDYDERDLRNHIDKLVQLSILEQAKDGDYRINSSIQDGLMGVYLTPRHVKELLKTRLEQENLRYLKELIGHLKENPRHDFCMQVFEFFVEKTTGHFLPINLKNYKSNSTVTFLDYVDPLYNQTVNFLKDETGGMLGTVKMSQLLLRHANFCLKTDRFTDARINFDHLKNLYAAYVKDSDSPDETCRKLAAKDPQLPALYAEYLHYSGRLFFFEKDIDKAGKLCEQANEIRKIIDKDKGKTYKEIGNPIDPKQNPPVLSSALDSVIFKRQLHGWLLLEKNDFDSLCEARKLYVDLLKHPLVKKDSFNEKYCKFQLVKVHHRFAKDRSYGSYFSTKDRREDYEKAHSYFEEVESLAKDPSASIPKGPSRFPETSELCFVIAELLLDKQNPRYNLEEAEKRLKEVEEQVKKERGINSDTPPSKEWARLNYYFAQLHFQRYLGTGTIEDLERAKFRASKTIEEFRKWHFDALFPPTEEYEKAKLLAGSVQLAASKHELEKYEKEYTAALIGT